MGIRPWVELQHLQDYLGVQSPQIHENRWLSVLPCERDQHRFSPPSNFAPPPSLPRAVFLIRQLIISIIQAREQEMKWCWLSSPAKIPPMDLSSSSLASIESIYFQVHNNPHLYLCSRRDNKLTKTNNNNQKVRQSNCSSHRLLLLLQPLQSRDSSVLSCLAFMG